MKQRKACESGRRRLPVAEDCWPSGLGQQSLVRCSRQLRIAFGLKPAAVDRFTVHLVSRGAGRWGLLLDRMDANVASRNLAQGSVFPSDLN
jgi:hypothetical protein